MTDPADVPARPDTAGSRSSGQWVGSSSTGTDAGGPARSGPPLDTEALPVTVLVESAAEPVAQRAGGTVPAASGRGPDRRPSGPSAPEVAVGDLLGPRVDRPSAGATDADWSRSVRPTRSQVRAARRLQARKVGRLVRHVDLWSLLKVALLFNTCLLLVGVVAGMVIWWALQRSGVLTSVEGFVEQIFLLEQFRFDGATVFRFGVLGGLFAVVVLSLLTVLGGLLFNLISDLTGGVRVSVVELETARPAPPRRRR